MAGSMNGNPLSMKDELPPDTVGLRDNFADVDRACTAWLLRNDPTFRASHEYYDRADGRKRNQGFDL